MELVPGRTCGECTVCCVLPNIDAPELQKPPGNPCVHLKKTGIGCSVHANLNSTCKAYHCAWRYMAGLGDDWRPDKSGILVDFQVEGLPPHYKKRPGIRLTLAGSRDTAFNPVFIDYVARLVAADVPVILAVPGPPGHFPASTFLNDSLKDAAKTGNFTRIKDFFTMLLGDLARHTFKPAVPQHGTTS